MKVKAIQFVPLGRMPKKGEWYRWGASGPIYDNCGLFCDIDYSWAVAQEGVEVEVDVPDPVPEWIAHACVDWKSRSRGQETVEQYVAAAFRAHVEERAKAAGAKTFGYTCEERERIIREEFLKP